MAKIFYNESELVFAKHPKDKRFQNLVDQRFERLLVLGFSGQTRTSQKMWFCKCDCGNVINIAGGNLKGGTTKSCGCFMVEKTKQANTIHGNAKCKNPSPEYHTWRQIRNRTLNKKCKDYHHYGGRGITVCDRWEKFENFLADMGKRPKCSSIDRIDNEKGYEPGNCRWSNNFEQANNKRNNIAISYNNETKNLSQWARHLGISNAVLWARLNRGWSVVKSFTTPIMKNYSRKIK